MSGGPIQTKSFPGMIDCEPLQHLTYLMGGPLLSALKADFPIGSLNEHDYVTKVSCFRSQILSAVKVMFEYIYVCAIYIYIYMSVQLLSAVVERDVCLHRIQVE